LNQKGLFPKFKGKIGETQPPGKNVGLERKNPGRPNKEPNNQIRSPGSGKNLEELEELRK